MRAGRGFGVGAGIGSGGHLAQAAPGFINQYGPTYQEGGLSFTTANGSPTGLFSWGLGQSSNADSDGATIALIGAPDWLVITRTGGGTFTINALDLATGFNSGTGTIGWRLTTGSGVTTGSFALDNLAGLQTFTFPASGVISFELATVSGPGGLFQLDNFNYALAAAVPEPASWAMMIGGFGLAGGLLRTRRRRSAALA